MVEALARLAELHATPATRRTSRSVLEGRLEQILERYLTRLSPIADVHVEGANVVCGVDLAEWRGSARPAAFRYAARPPGGGALPVEGRAGGRICVTLPHVAADGGRRGRRAVALRAVSASTTASRAGPWSPTCTIWARPAGTGSRGSSGRSPEGTAARPAPSRTNRGGVIRGWRVCLRRAGVRGLHLERYRRGISWRIPYVEEGEARDRRWDSGRLRLELAGGAPASSAPGAVVPRPPAARSLGPVRQACRARGRARVGGVRGRRQRPPADSSASQRHQWLGGELRHQREHLGPEPRLRERVLGHSRAMCTWKG